MGRGTSGDIFAVLLVAVAATMIFAAVGLWLHRHHRLLRRRGAAAIWALLTVSPLLAFAVLAYTGATF